jgi:hypothetical protein
LPSAPSARTEAFSFLIRFWLLAIFWMALEFLHFPPGLF